MLGSDSSDISRLSNVSPRSAAEVEKDKRRKKWDQALASTRIEGHLPDPEYLADIEAHVEGTLSDEEMQQRIIKRLTSRASNDGSTKNDSSD